MSPSPTACDGHLVQVTDVTTLVERCRHGDDGAWEALVTRFEGLVYQCLIRQGLRGDALLDGYQSVWLELHRSLPRLRDPEALPKWLIVTATRIGRRQRVLEARRSGEDLREEIADGADPESAYLDLEIRYRLEVALQALDDRCEEILRRLFLAKQKSSYREIAESLGVAEDSIGSLRQRCLRRLRQIMELDV